MASSASASTSSSSSPALPSPARGDEDWERRGPHGNADKTPTPTWIPITLLALTTCALAGPIILLRRAKNTIPQESIRAASTAPPPRLRALPLGPAPPRTVSSSAPPPRRVARLAPAAPNLRLPAAAPAAPIAASPAPTPEPTPTPVDPADDVNIPLFGLKAFTIATALVGAAACTTVGGVMFILDVDNTEQFARRVRYELATRMPVLSSRIHRTLGGSVPPAPDASASTPHLQRAEGTGELEWSWPDAERRLEDAYERGGFGGWADAALREVEDEGKVERARRGLV